MEYESESESILPEGRICREELEFYLKLDLSHFETVIDRRSYENARGIYFNRLQNVINCVNETAAKYDKYGFTTGPEEHTVSHAHNMYSKLYLQESGHLTKMPNETIPDSSRYQEEAKKQQLFRIKYNYHFPKLIQLITFMKNKASNCTFTEFHEITPQVEKCYFYIVNFILNFLPGRTFVKSIQRYS